MQGENCGIVIIRLIITKLTELWNRNKKSPPLPQTSTTAPTYFCMFTILILNSQSKFNCNCYQEPDWLFKIRIDAIPQFGEFHNTSHNVNLNNFSMFYVLCTAILYFVLGVVRKWF